MRCSFREADFRPAWLAIQWAKTGENYDNWENEAWPTFIARLEASNGQLTLVSPFGQASIPAEVEVPGVFFVNLREFIDTTAPIEYVKEPYEFHADDESFNYACFRTLAENTVMKLFRDPATAPQTWVPADEPEAEEYWDDEDEGDEDGDTAEELEDDAELDDEAETDDEAELDDKVKRDDAPRADQAAKPKPVISPFLFDDFLLTDDRPKKA